MENPMNRPVKWIDYITINIYWVSLSTVSNTMTPLVIPLLVQQFVGEQVKGEYFGNLRLWTLMVALLVQSLMGMVSDHSTLRWGRRRPFILIGSTFDLAIMAVIEFSAGLTGESGYYVLLFLVILLSVATNTAHAAQQGLIPDLVPSDLRGRFSGVKAVLEVPLPLIIVSFTIAKFISRGEMWAGILVAIGIVALCTAVTMFVPEKRLVSRPEPLNWQPFLRLLLMTGIFTGIILGMGWTVKAVGRFTSGMVTPTGLLVTMGVVGLLAMLVAVGFGVWVSVRVGLGKSVRDNPSYTWWIVNRLAFLVGVTNLASFTVYFLQARLGFVREAAAGPASILTMFVGVFILLTAVPSGWLADRFGHRRLVMIAGFVAAMGTAVALSLPSLPMIYTGGVLIGAATGLFFAANWALGTELVPKNQAGKYLGVSNLAGAGAGAIGAYIGGPIADMVGRQLPSTPEVGYLLLFGIYGAMFLFSILALRGVASPGKAAKPVPAVKISIG